MATLLQPPVMHGRVVSGGGNKDKQAQRPWWDGNKPVSPRQPWQLGGNEARAVANQVLSVLRCDGEFLQAGRPPPVPRDVFWLRFLEKKQGKQQQIRGGLARQDAARRARRRQGGARRLRTWLRPRKVMQEGNKFLNS